MIKLLRDFKKYTSYIGNDPLFNLSCFLMSKDIKDKQFFTDLTQGQNFRQFLLTSYNSKQDIIYYEYLAMHFNIMIDDQDTSVRCNTENNLSARETFSSFFRSKPKPPSVLSKFLGLLDSLPTSVNQDILLQEKNDEHYITPYFMNRNSIPNFTQLENLVKTNTINISNKPETMLFDKLPEFNKYVDIPTEVRLYNLDNKPKTPSFSKKKTIAKSFKKASTKRATFKIKEDFEEEYRDLKKSSSNHLPCNNKLGCNIIN
jgi:hypothetical protein